MYLLTSRIKNHTGAPNPPRLVPLLQHILLLPSQKKHGFDFSSIILLLFNSPYTLFPFSSLPVTIFTEITTERGKTKEAGRRG